MALKGIKVVELAGLAPAPFCGMILSDFGANVIRVDKVSPVMDIDRLARGKRSIAINLKHQTGVTIIQKLCSTAADVLIEPFRRGVMEKLGLGPQVLLSSNPKLIYARLSGFGQNGPYADMAGHDINYIAVSGLLSTIGRQNENPVPPINLLGDFAGGGLIGALGICLALLERNVSGRGQVIDINMVEGSAYVGTWLWTSRNLPIWGKSRGENLLDTGFHNYETYKTKDGKFMAIGCLEPKFYSKMIEVLGLHELPDLGDERAAKEKMATIFASKTQKEWMELVEGHDACVTPVLDLDEAPLHPHNKERGTFFKNSKGSYEPRPAPLLTRTAGVASCKSPAIGEHTMEILQEMGYTQDKIKELEKNGTVEVYKPVPAARL